MSFPIKLNESVCTQCGMCEDSCLYQALQMQTYPAIDESACQLCKNCVEACPSGALTFSADDSPVTLSSTCQAADGIWVLAEQQKGKVVSVTYELLGEARRLADMQPQPVAALLIGHQCREEVGKLFAAGADIVYLAEHSRLDAPIEDNYAEVIAAQVRFYHPAILLIGATHFGRGVSARVAAMLDTGLTADCTELSIDPVSGNLLQRRPAFGGNLLATIETPRHRPQMASVRPQVMKALIPDQSRKGEPVVCDLSQVTISDRVKLLAGNIHEAIASITEAPVLVAGGKGMQNERNVSLLYELADALGGTVAASRAAVEAGWLPVERQVGQTGQTVAPRLYIACGISGQIQHTAAISGAQTVIAINNDPDAPIFRYADYGLVGDVEEILPRLIGELRNA